MANHMAEVAKMLGVELGEAFYINESSDFICTIYNDGLCVYPTRDDIRILPTHGDVLSCLLEGNMTIKCKPWKPKKDEDYWLVNQCGNVISLAGIDNLLCITNYKIGNCYRTREEAEANRDKWIKFYASDEVLEV